jgi:DNA polymerase (family 10)
VKNQDISRIFRNIASILEINGENVFRIRAYQRAAQSIDGLSADVEEYLRQDKLREIPGIGKELSGHIREYCLNGKIKLYEELKKSVPEAVLAMLEIPSVGPKTAKLFYEKLKIKNLDGLEQAIKKGRLKGVAGIKEKTIENILRGIAIVKQGRERMPLAEADGLAGEFASYLRSLPEVEELAVAGSLRRQKETVRDIDILVVSRQPRKALSAFTSFRAVKDIAACGETKAAVRTQKNIQVDCRVVEKRSFGAALVYFTGSKDFNIAIRQLAVKNGLKINEYGVFRKDKFIAGETEQAVFKTLGMAYVEPELRENAGEIKLALENKLPRLLGPGEIKGDLHCHSDWSDGANTIAQMADAARELGYAYIAIADHSQGLKVAGGLTLAELGRKKKQIEKLNSSLRGIRVLYATEVDIASDGKIDYPDNVLREFDIVVAALHSGFAQPREKLTKRVIAACRNKYVHIIAHPTGRLWGERQGYELDFAQVFQAARETNTALEINAFARRLDINSAYCRQAKEAGVRLAIGTDAHALSQLAAMRFGVAVARRGWLGPEDVLNTLPAEQLLKTIRK